MPFIEYIPKKFSAAHLEVIDQANTIIREYMRQGYTLTLRQVYYQFVARGLLANKLQEYKRLSSVLNDARLAGLVDWRSMEDRTRNMRRVPDWESPAQVVEIAANQFKYDLWDEQDNYVETWVEKDALIGVIERACNRHRVPYFSCRGYTSQSELWSASQRLAERIRSGKRVVILHLGDHDPSGIDMTRDIIDRLTLFLNHEGYYENSDFEVKRLALNMDQIDQYSPPPNPAKLSDSRATGYIDRFGYESWELDALEPAVITDLIERNVIDLRDEDLWDRGIEREKNASAAIREHIQALKDEEKTAPWGPTQYFDHDSTEDHDDDD